MMLPFLAPMLLAAFAAAPALQEQEPEPPPLEILEYQALEAFDHDTVRAMPTLPPGREDDMAKLQWLQSAAALPIPVSVFRKGSPESLEADALLRFIGMDRVPPELDIEKVPLALTGSQLALWRHGRVSIREGRWDSKIRISWENRLIEAKTHPIIRGLALRHALCWALADGDEKRFAELKYSKAGEDMPSIVTLFQKAFALLGGPLAPLRLWDTSLEELPAEQAAFGRIWISPAADLPPPDHSATWIYPILGQAGFESGPALAWMSAAEELLKDNALAGYSVFFAPSQDELEMLGMALFPVLMELDQNGDVASVKMGDACPSK
jgi:hypothetical protein